MEGNVSIEPCVLQFMNQLDNALEEVATTHMPPKSAAYPNSPAFPTIPVESSYKDDENELFPPLVAEKKRKLTRKLSEPSHRLAKPVKPILKHSNTTGSVLVAAQRQTMKDRRGGRMPTTRRRSHSFGPYSSNSTDENNLRRETGDKVYANATRASSSGSDKDEFWTPRSSISNSDSMDTEPLKVDDKRNLTVSANAEKYKNRSLPAVPAPLTLPMESSTPPVLQRAPSSLSPFSSTSHRGTPKGDYFSGLTRLNTDVSSFDSSLKRRRTLSPGYSPSLSPGGRRAPSTMGAFNAEEMKSTVPFPTRESFSFTVSKTPLNTPVATAAPGMFHSESSSAIHNWRPPSPPRRSSRTLDRAQTQGRLRRLSLFRSKSSKNSKSENTTEGAEVQVTAPKKRKVSFRLPSGHENSKETKPGFKRKLTPYYPESLTSTFDRVMTSILSPFRTKSSEDIRMGNNDNEEANTVAEDDTEVDYEDTIDIDSLCTKILKNPKDLTEQEKKLLPKYNTILKMKVRKQRKDMEKLEKILAENAKELESLQTQEEKERKAKEKREEKTRRELEWSFHSEL